MSHAVLNQVLSPTKKTAAGTLALNQQLQELLNPPAEQKHEMALVGYHHQQVGDGSRGAGVPVWRVGDRVVHLENDPDREVYNGDLGYIDAISDTITSNKRGR